MPTACGDSRRGAPLRQTSLRLDADRASKACARGMQRPLAQHGGNPPRSTSMGLRLTLVMIGDANIARIHEDPPLTWQVIAADEPELYAQARAPEKPSLIKRLFGGGASAT